MFILKETITKSCILNLKQISVHQFNQNREKIDLQQYQKKLTPQPKNQPLITQYKKIKNLELIIEENQPVSLLLPPSQINVEPI